MTLPFALNHMVAPRKSLTAFFDLAQVLAVQNVEIRNDLSGIAITDGTSATTVRDEAAKRGLTIISINALQRFNDWNAERASQAAALIAYARTSGAEALVLCPVNDTGFHPADVERLSGLRDALRALAPMLRDAGLIGLVEPLGFAECSLRSKREAVEAIDAVDAADVFKLVHDTFHHHVAGEPALFPNRTGLIHASGVTDPAVPASSMRDPHRVLVDQDDRIDNVGQIHALMAGGYRGALSFEPFAASVAALPDARAALTATMNFVGGEVRAKAA